MAPRFSSRSRLRSKQPQASVQESSTTMTRGRSLRKVRGSSKTNDVPLVDITDDDDNGKKPTRQQSAAKVKTDSKTNKPPQRQASKRSLTVSPKRNNKKRRTTEVKVTDDETSQSVESVVAVDALNSPRAKRDSTRNSSKSSASLIKTPPKLTPKSPVGTRKQTISAKKSTPKSNNTSQIKVEQDLVTPKSTRRTRSSGGTAKVDSGKPTRNSKTPTSVKKNLPEKKTTPSIKVTTNSKKKAAAVKQNVSIKKSATPKKSTPVSVRSSRVKRLIKPTSKYISPPKISTPRVKKQTVTPVKKSAKVKVNKKASKSTSKTTPKNDSPRKTRGRPKKRKASDDIMNKDSMKGEVFVKIRKLEMEDESEDESSKDQSLEESNDANDAMEITTDKPSEGEVKDETKLEVADAKEIVEDDSKTSEEAKKNENELISKIDDSETGKEIEGDKEMKSKVDESSGKNDASDTKKDDAEIKGDAKDDVEVKDDGGTSTKSDDEVGVISESKDKPNTEEINGVSVKTEDDLSATSDTAEPETKCDKLPSSSDNKTEGITPSESSGKNEEDASEQPTPIENEDQKSGESGAEKVGDDDRATNGVEQPADGKSDLKCNENDDEEEVFCLTMNTKLLRRRVVSARRYLDTCENDTQPISFAIVSYNLLGKDWSTNHQKLIDEILRLNPSILCLQDVSEVYYKNFLVASLEKLNFKSVYVPSESKEIGLATFIKTSSFEIVQHKDYTVRNLIDKELQQLELPEIEKEKCQAFLKSPGHVLLTILKCKDNNQTLIVSSVNLPSSEELELAVQLIAIIKKTLEFSSNEAYLMCGTFTLDEQSQINNYLKDGNLERQTWRKLKEKSEATSSSKLFNLAQNLIETCISDTSTKLESAYHAVLGRELELPNKDAKTVKDSIWFGSDFLQEQTVFDVCSSSVLPDSSIDCHVSLQAELEFL
ncbi:hypothetical protein CHUAL_007820 [Chamberlinius hualienensis]